MTNTNLAPLALVVATLTLLLFVPSVSTDPIDSVPKLAAAPEQERAQALAQIGPEKEGKIQNALIEEAHQIVGPVKINEAELKEPKGVAGLCKQLSQRVHCEKATRSKETCLGAKALLDIMGDELGHSSPEEMDQKSHSFHAEIVQIVQNMGKKGSSFRRTKRGFMRMWWKEMKQMWSEWWLKQLLQKGTQNDDWKEGKYAKFIFKFLGTVVGAPVAALLEIPAKIVITVFISCLLAVVLSVVATPTFGQYHCHHHYW